MSCSILVKAIRSPVASLKATEPWEVRAERRQQGLEMGNEVEFNNMTELKKKGRKVVVCR
jgi:hypothetical protein